MKKIITLVVSALLLAGGMPAQQINGDFSAWQECTPDGQDPTSVMPAGKEPVGWSASNVVQFFPFDKLVRDTLDRKGDGASRSVLMMNRYCGALGIGSTAPGFITLGNTWVYADVAGLMHDQYVAKFEVTYGADWRNKREEMSDEDKTSYNYVVTELEGAGITADMSDGGSFGGMAFTFRPDSIVGYIKREHSEEDDPATDFYGNPTPGAPNKNEIAKIIAYSWTGTSRSSVKQGLDMDGSIAVSEIVDRDKDVLGMITEGVTGDAQLIASADKTITGDFAEWTYVAVPLTYKNKEVKPEKVNIVLSASDYYNRKNLGGGNTLWADDFRFVYNSKLKELNINGLPLEGFNKNIFNYTVRMAVPSKEAITVVSDGIGSTVEISDPSDNKIVITVKGNDVESNPENVHIYTLTFKDVAGVDVYITDAAAPITAIHIDDPDGVLANGMKPTFSFVESGPYWNVQYYVRKDAENLKNLVFSFDARDSEAQVIDGGGMWIVMKEEDYSTIIPDEKAVNVLDVTLTDDKLPIAGFHIADPMDILATDVAPTFIDMSGYWQLTYYVKQGQEANLSTVTITFDPKAGSRIADAGGMWVVFDEQGNQSIIMVSYESVIVREPIVEIKESLVYDFNADADWINVDGKYDEPTDWASSNPSGMVLKGDYPVKKFVEGDNSYLLLSTKSPGYETPSTMIPNIVSGSVFYGNFSLNIGAPLKSTKFGLPIKDGYISKVNGKFKYKSGDIFYDNYTVATPNKKDNWSVVVAIYEVNSYNETRDGTNLSDLTNTETPMIAYGELLGNEAADWTEFECPVYLLSADKKMEAEKLYKATVVISSSFEGAYYKGSIGSELCLDDLNVVYDKEAPGIKPSSIDIIDTKSAISIYPNPVTDIIRVAGGETDSSYCVSNIAGAIMKSGELNGEINVSDLSNGIYFLQIDGQVLKFIKK